MTTPESTPPPEFPAELSEDSGPSFYHKAAKYAVVVLLVTFVINLLAQAGSTKGTNAVTQVISMIGGLLFLSAVPAGIIALVGIRRHGCSYLLWRGLVGILVPCLLLALAVPAFLKVRSLAGAAQLQSVAKTLN